MVSSRDGGGERSGGRRGGGRLTDCESVAGAALCLAGLGLNTASVSLTSKGELVGGRTNGLLLPR
jgi:hypothetical protein